MVADTAGAAAINALIPGPRPLRLPYDARGGRAAAGHATACAPCRQSSKAAGRDMGAGSVSVSGFGSVSTRAGHKRKNNTYHSNHDGLHHVPRPARWRASSALRGRGAWGLVHGHMAGLRPLMSILITASLSSTMIRRVTSRCVGIEAGT